MMWTPYMMQKDHYILQDCTQSKLRREPSERAISQERQGILEGPKPRRDRRKLECLSGGSKREQL